MDTSILAWGYQHASRYPLPRRIIGVALQVLPEVASSLVDRSGASQAEAPSRSDSARAGRATWYGAKHNHSLRAWALANGAEVCSVGDRGTCAEGQQNTLR